MKIKTNIYHVTATNGEYEDFSSWAVTIQARNLNEAHKIGLEKLVKMSGMEPHALCHFNVETVFENVELEVPTPEPFTVTVDYVDFTYHYDRETLEIKTAYESCEISKSHLQKLATYLNELVKTL